MNQEDKDSLEQAHLFNHSIQTVRLVNDAIRVSEKQPIPKEVKD